VDIKTKETEAINHLLSKSRLMKDSRDGSLDSMSSEFSTKSNTSRLTEQSQAFSFSSLRRPQKNIAPTSENLTLLASKILENKEPVPKPNLTGPAHTQLVNCKGRDEVLLDSDNLSTKKFQCTRRRDESFV